MLAATVLRDRWQRGEVDREMREGFRHATAAIAPVAGQLERLTDLEGVVRDARTALDDLSMVRVLTGAEVTAALAEARRHTDVWMFKGGTGTYIRAVTLPDCVEVARREKRTLSFRLEILDPSDEAACARYAQFRNGLLPAPDGTGEPWTVDRTRKEAFATVLAACWYRQRFPLLDVEVRLSSVMTTFRFDLSSTCVIITQEDPRAPAMMISRGRFYYERWRTELRASLEQGRRVPTERGDSVRLAPEPTVDEVRRLFTVLDLPLPSTFSDRLVADIVARAVQPKNPYEP